MSSLRRYGRYLLLALGAVAFLFALSPTLSASFPADVLTEWLGNDYFLLAAFGVVAVAVFAWMAGRRAIERVDQASPPDPETVLAAPRPGTAFDRRIDGWPVFSARRRDGDDAFRERLRTAAVAAEMRQRDCSAAIARERVADGRWTDDDVAARFLRANVSGPSVADRLRLLFRGDSWTQYGMRKTAAAITGRTELDRGRGSHG